MVMNSRIGGIITMHDREQGENNGITLRNLIKILINDTTYNPPFPVYNGPNFKLVSLLECLSRNDINDIPQSYIIQNDEDDTMIYVYGSIILFVVIIISCFIGYCIAKRKYFSTTNKNLSESDQMQLVTK